MLYKEEGGAFVFLSLKRAAICALPSIQFLQNTFIKDHTEYFPFGAATICIHKAFQQHHIMQIPSHNARSTLSCRLPKTGTGLLLQDLLQCTHCGRLAATPLARMDHSERMQWRHLPGQTVCPGCSKEGWPPPPVCIPQRNHYIYQYIIYTGIICLHPGCRHIFRCEYGWSTNTDIPPSEQRIHPCQSLETTSTSFCKQPADCIDVINDY